MARVASRAEIVVRLAKVVELALADLGLTENQYRALTLIDDGTQPLGEFAVRLAMQPPNVSTLIDGLVARELVVRERDPQDGRRVLLRLTTRGRTLVARADERASHALAAVAAFDERRARSLLSGIDDWQLALEAVATDLRENLGSAARVTSRR
jgi:DNA-binding MarR family transcriptional regulator